MRLREEVITELVQQWLDRAHTDFGAATVLLEEGRYLSVVGFHSQQAAEKSLKALLVHHQVEFPKTHKLDELLTLLAPLHPALTGSLAGVAAALNSYGVEVRYPGDLPELTLQTASAAVEHASRVRRAVYAALGEPAPDTGGMRGDL